jgi:hypothetical protein
VKKTAFSLKSIFLQNTKILRKLKYLAIFNAKCTFLLFENFPHNWNKTGKKIFPRKMVAVPGELVVQCAVSKKITQFSRKQNSAKVIQK